MRQAALLDRDDPNYGSASFPPPRPFQDTAHQKLREGARAGHRRQLLMAPTGAGKTYLGLRAIHEGLMKDRRALFLCDRRTIISQTSEAADGYGLSAHGVIQASHWRVDMDMPFQIGSVQTIQRREWPKADLIVIDECHTMHATWVRHIMECDAHVIGLSATPFSPGLGKIFTNLVNAATMHELTEEGTLVPLRIYTCKPIDMRGAEAKTGAEWTDRAAAERGMKVVGDVVAGWFEYGEGRKTIGFGANIAHCEELCRQFNDAGVMAATFTSNTTDAERKVILDEYRKPDSIIRVLISVEALAKGFDVRDVGCIFDARPLRKSLSTYIQMVGRGFRSSPETGKIDCILLDFSGNIVRFADDFSDIYFNGLGELDAGEKLDKTIRQDDEEVEKKPSKCQACGFSPCGKRCISCGHERHSTSLIEHLPGAMEEVRIGKTKLADTSKHLYEQLCTYTKAHGNPDTASKRAWHLFKDFTGGKVPDRGWEFEAQPNTVIAKEVMNRIRHRTIQFVKGAGKK